MLFRETELSKIRKITIIAIYKAEILETKSNFDNLLQDSNLNNSDKYLYCDQLLKKQIALQRQKEYLEPEIIKMLSQDPKIINALSQIPNSSQNKAEPIKEFPSYESLYERGKDENTVDVENTSQKPLIVEKVLKKSKVDGMWHYHVKFKGYGNKFNSWVREDQLEE